MAATSERDTQFREAVEADFPVAAATQILQGVIVALDASGNAVEGSDTAALKVVGRAEATADNTGGSAGDLTVRVRRGCFLLANSATQAVTAAYKGKLVYVEDNETVAISTTNKIVAGRVVEVASDGVWVDTSDRPLTAAVTDTTTDGAAAGAADLSALKTEAEAIGDTLRALLARLV